MTTHIAIVEVTDENKDALVEIALSMYLGESCKYCLKVYETLEDLKDVVFAGHNGILACKSCWKENNPYAKNKGDGNFKYNSRFLF